MHSQRCAAIITIFPIFHYPEQKPCAPETTTSHAAPGSSFIKNHDKHAVKAPFPMWVPSRAPGTTARPARPARPPTPSPCLSSSSPGPGVAWPRTGALGTHPPGSRGGLREGPASLSALPVLVSLRVPGLDGLIPTVALAPGVGPWAAALRHSASPQVRNWKPK